LTRLEFLPQAVQKLSLFFNVRAFRPNIVMVFMIRSIRVVRLEMRVRERTTSLEIPMLFVPLMHILIGFALRDVELQ